MKISIKGTKMDLTQPIKDYVNEKIGSLEKFTDRIIDARVEVEKTTNHHQKGDVFRAEANLRVTGKIIRAEAVRHDLYIAINQVKDELQRELKKYNEMFNTKHRKKGRLLTRLTKISPFARFRRGKEMKGLEEIE